MGFIREEFVGYECDGCGKIFEDGDGYSFCVDEQCVMEKMEEGHWLNVDGKFYCPDCIHYDEEKDELVVNKERENHG